MDERDTILKALLGEATPDEAARAAELASGSPDAARMTAELQRMLAALDDGRALDREFAIPDGARAGLYAQAPRRTTSAAAAIGQAAARAAEVVVAMLTLDTWRDRGLAPAIRGSDGSRRMRFEVDGARVDLRLDRSPTRLDEHTCVGQLVATGDQTAPPQMVWREMQTRIEHAVSLDADGFFDLVVTGPTHQIEFRTAGRVVRTPVIEHRADTPPQPRGV
jgi:hypothetical protein